MPFAILILLILTLSCTQNPHTPMPPSPDINLKNYTGSLYEGNYIWTGAMNLCWTALSQTVIKEPISIKTEDSIALAMAEKFNHPACTTDDLDEPSYYIKAGIGPKTLAAINRESREKFPQKSFGDLDMPIGDDGIISYAYFYKKVSYEKPFTKCDIYFDSTSVKGFEAIEKQKQTVEVLQYDSDDKFIIRLRLKSQGDELILAKGYQTQDPSEILASLNEIKGQSVSRLGDDDHFRMPLLKLSCRRDYEELIGKSFANPGFTDFIIAAMFENINFELDEEGAKVESQAVIGAERGAMAQKTGRYFYLNKAFWVIMRREDSTRPYFLLGVNNAKIMMQEK